MAPSSKTIVAFDLYGTLLSTASISKELAKIIGEEKAAKVSAQARTYQLEYTWRSNSMGIHESFSDLTRWSFRQAALEVGEKLTAQQEDQIMDAYNGLDTFPDVDDALSTLRSEANLDPYIFSNGTVSMVTTSLATSPSLAKASDILPMSKVVSVEPIKIFKPDRRVYDYVVQKAGMEGHSDQVWLVSSNAFDALGAAVAGMNSVWVDRAGFGWIDGLGGAMGVKPAAVVKGVDEAINTIIKHIS